MKKIILLIVIFVIYFMKISALMILIKKLDQSKID